MHLIKEQEWKSLPESAQQEVYDFLYLLNSAMVDLLITMKAQALAYSQIIVRIA